MYKHTPGDLYFVDLEELSEFILIDNYGMEGEGEVAAYTSWGVALQPSAVEDEEIEFITNIYEETIWKI